MHMKKKILIKVLPFFFSIIIDEKKTKIFIFKESDSAKNYGIQPIWNKRLDENLFQNFFTGQYENHWFGFSGKQMLRWSLLCRIFLKNCLGVNTHGKKGMKAESGRERTRAMLQPWQIWLGALRWKITHQRCSLLSWNGQP